MLTRTQTDRRKGHDRTIRDRTGQSKTGHTGYADRQYQDRQGTGKEDPVYGKTRAGRKQTDTDRQTDRLGTACLSACQSVSLSVFCLSVCLPVCLSVCLSVRPCSLCSVAFLLTNRLGCGWTMSAAGKLKPADQDMLPKILRSATFCCAAQLKPEDFRSRLI